jgi:Zn-finger nucleic acid-binding protein
MTIDCPQCREKLTTQDYGFIGAASCLYCEGVWLPGTAFSTAITQTTKIPDLSVLLQKTSDSGAPKDNLICPTCAITSFRSIETKESKIDLCTQCGGIYFEKGEIEKLFPSLNLQNPNSSLGKAITTNVTADVVTLIAIALFSGGGC